MAFYREKDNKVLLNICVVPRSSKTEVSGIYGDSLKIKLKSPPVDNSANEELISFLAEKLKLSKSSIKIVSGLTQKRKIISLSGYKISNIEGSLL